VFAVWNYVVNNADSLGIDKNKIVIGGESAGGGLSAMLVNRLHDLGGQEQPIGQWLLCPMLDDRTAADRELEKVGHILWTNHSNYVGWKAFLGQEPGLPTVPDLSVPARRLDFTGLPPTWIGVGTIDLFYKEDVEYAKRLKEAKVPCELVEQEGGIHAFEMLLPSAPISIAFRGKSIAWLTKQLK